MISPLFCFLLHNLIFTFFVLTLWYAGRVTSTTWYLLVFLFIVTISGFLIWVRRWSWISYTFFYVLPQFLVCAYNVYLRSRTQVVRSFSRAPSLLSVFFLIPFVQFGYKLILSYTYLHKVTFAILVSFDYYCFSGNDSNKIFVGCNDKITFSLFRCSLLNHNLWLYACDIFNLHLFSAWRVLLSDISILVEFLLFLQ